MKGERSKETSLSSLSDPKRVEELFEERLQGGAKGQAYTRRRAKNKGEGPQASRRMEKEEGKGGHLWMVTRAEKRRGREETVRSYPTQKEKKRVPHLPSQRNKGEANLFQEKRDYGLRKERNRAYHVKTRERVRGELNLKKGEDLGFNQKSKATFHHEKSSEQSHPRPGKRAEKRKEGGGDDARGERAGDFRSEEWLSFGESVKGK